MCFCGLKWKLNTYLLLDTRFTTIRICKLFSSDEKYQKSAIFTILRHNVHFQNGLLLHWNCFLFWNVIRKARQTDYHIRPFQLYRSLFRYFCLSRLVSRCNIEIKKTNNQQKKWTPKNVSVVMRKVVRLLRKKLVDSGGDSMTQSDRLNLRHHHPLSTISWFHAHNANLWFSSTTTVKHLKHYVYLSFVVSYWTAKSITLIQ